jgi:hypothetical protein
LGAGNISCIVGDIACGVGGGIGWRIGCSVGNRIGCGVGSEIGRLHYFVFISYLFSYWFKGTVATTSLARMFQSSPGVGTCGRSAVSRASFFDLSSGDAEVGLETSYYRSVFELELRPGSLEGSCRLRGDPAQSPSGDL